MAAKDKEAATEKQSQDGASEEDARKESSKVAKQATEAQKKATELMKAAAAAGDPEERQKLMEQALEQQIQSKSLGKTARYLRSGTFQGMAVGAGLGIAPGASLGAISGTLVGGVTSTALCGLGAGVGAATGALHGPFWDVGKGAGKGIQKITGLLPGWKATESQKKQLEKMVGQINEQGAPGMDELESWTNESSTDDQKGAVENVKSAMPSMPTKEENDESGRAEESEKDKGKPEKPNKTNSATQELEDANTDTSNLENGNSDTNDDDEREESSTANENANSAQTQAQHTQSNYKDAAVQTGEAGRKKPRKLQSKPEIAKDQLRKPIDSKKQPRKLEKRSS